MSKVDRSWLNLTVSEIWHTDGRSFWMGSITWGSWDPQMKSRAWRGSTHRNMHRGWGGQGIASFHMIVRGLQTPKGRNHWFLWLATHSAVGHLSGVSQEVVTALPFHMHLHFCLSHKQIVLGSWAFNSFLLKVKTRDRFLHPWGDTTLTTVTAGLWASGVLAATGGSGVWWGRRVVWVLLSYACGLTSSSMFWSYHTQ
jgi:hypothetical protein